MKLEEMGVAEIRAALASPLFGEAAKDRLRALLAAKEPGAAAPAQGPPGGGSPAPRVRRAGRIIWDRLPCPTNQLWVPAIASKGPAKGRPILVKSKRARDWTAWARRQAEAQWAGDPLVGLVEVRAKVFFDPEAEPDFDAGKQLWDALEGIAYRKDSLVRRSVIEKLPTAIGAPAYVEVWIRPWSPR